MRPIVLTIGGSDPTGGAGIEADLQTVRELGGHGAAVVTALTVQDTARVHDVVPVPAEVVARRLRVLLADLLPAAIKTGMLADGEVVAAVAEAIPHDIPLVVDPVISSSSGATLLDGAGLAALRSRLLPRATVIVPNLGEAAILAGSSHGDPRRLVAELLALGAGAVVVTGGDAGGDEVVDVFGCAAELTEMRAPRLAGPSPHGTGCRFSASLAMALARGVALREAVDFARLDVRRAIARASSAPGSSGKPLLGLAGETGNET